MPKHIFLKENNDVYYLLHTFKHLYKCEMFLAAQKNSIDKKQ